MARRRMRTRARPRWAPSSTASCGRTSRPTSSAVWYEPEDNLGEGYLKEYEARVAAEAAADEESAREDAELEALEEAEALARDE